MKNNSLVASPRLSVASALSLMILALTSVNSALAQQWKVEPVLKVGGEYDDNAELDARTDEELDDTGFLLDARANITYASPSTSFFVQPKAVIRNYSDEGSLDSDDYFLRSNFRRKGSLNTIGFRANFDRQSVRTGERIDSDLEIEDPDEIIDDETGLASLQGERSKWRFAPYWQYQFSQLSSIGAEINYSDVQYDDVLSVRLSDYSDARVNLNYRRSLSNVTTGLISLTARRYDTEQLVEDIEGFGVAAGIERALSPQTSIKAEIGMEDTDRPGDSSDNDVVGSVSLVHNLETIRLFALYRRSYTASGNGSVSIRDSFNLSFRRRLSEKLSAGLGVNGYRSEDVDAAITNVERNQIQLRSSFVWYLSRQFVIEADYRYTVLDRGNVAGGRANSNRINLWFVYQPRTIPGI